MQTLLLPIHPKPKLDHELKDLAVPRMEYILQSMHEIKRDKLLLRLYPNQWYLSKMRFGKLLFKHSVYGEALVFLSAKRGRVVIYPHPAEIPFQGKKHAHSSEHSSIVQTLQSDNTIVLKRDKDCTSNFDSLMTEPLQKTTLKNLYGSVYELPY